MKAADVAKQQAAKLTPPPHTFVLGPAAFADTWLNRPTTPQRVGLKRAPAEDRIRCDAEAVARADKLMPVHRRTPEDPMWQRIYEITFIHYLLGFSLCDPQDVNKPLWPSQDGVVMLTEVTSGKPGECPVASARFSEAGVARCFDELDILARLDPIGRRMATDEDLVRLGAVLADGTFFARLRAADTGEAHAVGEHVRMLAGAMLDVMENGREAPLPMSK